MYDDIAVLYSATESQDEYGNIKETYTGTEVFVKPRSIYANEFYRAATAGMKPEVVLILSNPADYSGEKIVKFHDTFFDIIRVYQKPERDTVELVCENRIHDLDLNEDY